MKIKNDLLTVASFPIVDNLRKTDYLTEKNVTFQFIIPQKIVSKKSGERAQSGVESETMRTGNDSVFFRQNVATSLTDINLLSLRHLFIQNFSS